MLTSSHGMPYHPHLAALTTVTAFVVVVVHHCQTAYHQ